MTMAATTSFVSSFEEQQQQYHHDSDYRYEEQQRQQHCEGDSSSEAAPVINLKMKPLTLLVEQDENDAHQHDPQMIANRLRIMDRQCNVTYKCANDYIYEQQQQIYKYNQEQINRFREKNAYYELLDDSEETMIDTLCREKMCEWSYKIADHFHVPRDAVAVSMSCLDRFVASYYNTSSNSGEHILRNDEQPTIIDRTTFKLAAITSLYLTSKLHYSDHNIDTKKQSPIPISTHALSELSHGEFTPEDITEMELLILKQIKWLVHPPTVQEFISILIEGYLKPILSSSLPSTLLSSHSSSSISSEQLNETLSSIQHRATFFAELVAFDYHSSIQESTFKTAISCIINAMEGISNNANKNTNDYPQGVNPEVLKMQDLCSVMNQRCFIETLEREFLAELQQQDNDDLMTELLKQYRENSPRDTHQSFSLIESIDSIRDRLWYLYTNSVQYLDDCYCHDDGGSTNIDQQQQQPQHHYSSYHPKQHQLAVIEADEEERRDDPEENCNNNTLNSGAITIYDDDNYMNIEGEEEINKENGKKQHQKSSSPVGVIVFKDRLLYEC